MPTRKDICTKLLTNKNTTELQTEVLLAIISFFMAMSVAVVFFSELFSTAWSVFHKTTRSRKDPNIIDKTTANLFFSAAYAISLPLLSYLFSQAKQDALPDKALVILTWMVFIEIIRVAADPIFSWAPKRAAEQFVHLVWVAYLVLVYSSAPHDNSLYSKVTAYGTSACLLTLCAYFAISLILKGVMLHKANNSYYIGQNPKLIHNYVERLQFEGQLHTTPMSNCDYIVMGEENHKIAGYDDGYHLEEKKPGTPGILTIGRVFQLTSPGNKKFPTEQDLLSWRNNCVSLALAKLLRCRFAKLPIHEVGCKEALDFVLEGIIGYIGKNKDIPPDEKIIGNQTERVFIIICEELKIVSEFLQMKVPVYHYFLWYMLVDMIGAGIVVVAGSFIILSQTLSVWHCAFKIVLKLSGISKFSSISISRRDYPLAVSVALHPVITVFLCVACFYVQCIGLAAPWSKHWIILKVVKWYTDTVKWKKIHCLVTTFTKSISIVENLMKIVADHIKKKLATTPKRNGNKVRVRSSVLDLKAETIFLCIKVDWCILVRLNKFIRRNILRANPTSFYSTGTKEAVLESLSRNKGQLTNGETSLKNHSMEQLINWACPPNGSTSEAILVWHIATSLFDHQNSSSEQNRGPLKERVVAVELSNYCHYLVVFLPELLPDEVGWTENMYEGVITEMLKIDGTFCWKRTKKNLCTALHDKWGENSMVTSTTPVVEKGVKLAKDLMKCAEGRDRVWKMLAEFWTEMILFVAPSDNVKAHEKILHQQELITQLWALLTHAGILRRPIRKPTYRAYHMSESNKVTGEENV